MELKIVRSTLDEIRPLRELFLQQADFQVRYNACHDRNWSDSWLLTSDDIKIGYGSIKGKDNLNDRNAIFEFFVIPQFENLSGLLFQELLRSSGAGFIESQSNDINLSNLLYEFSENINSDVILFADHKITKHSIPRVHFRARRDGDIIFMHDLEPVGDFILELDQEVIATGGFMLYYNPPFADLYMEVEEKRRRKGYGSFLLQELKKECYRAGRVPAARCNIGNFASRASLLRAGLKICGYMLSGKIKNPMP